MKLENIIIENYRQFDKAELSFDQGITILAGANNSGKTSLINLIRSVFVDEKNDYSVSDMSDPKISTQHGVKGESHDTVVFVSDNSRSNPVVHMSKFFEMWSNINITLSEFDAFYYIYMINKKDIEGFENRLRNKLIITGFNVL